MTTDRPTLDVYKLVLGRNEPEKDKNPLYFFLIPEEFVQRQFVICQTFEVYDYPAGQPIRIHEVGKFLEALQELLHNFYHIDRLYAELGIKEPNLSPYMGQFPIAYANIFERSGLKLPLFYQMFGKQFEMEILYTLDSHLFLSWLDEIRSFYENMPQMEIKLASMKKYNALQKTLNHCEILAETILGIYDSAKFTIWRDMLSEQLSIGYDRYYNMSEAEIKAKEWELYPDSKQCAIKNRFRRFKSTPTMALPLLQHNDAKILKKAWLYLKLKEECEDFFRKWIAYCHDSKICLFISIPVFAVEHPWLVLDILEKEMPYKMRGIRQHELDGNYVPLLVHPTVIELFENAQDLQAFENSNMMQYLWGRMKKLRTIMDGILTNPSERSNIRRQTCFYFHYPMSLFEKWHQPEISYRSLDTKYYSHYFHQSFMGSSGEEEWPFIGCDGKFSDVNGKMYYFMTRVGKYLASGVPFQIVDNTGKTANLDQEIGWTTRCNMVINYLKYPRSDMKEGLPLAENHDYLSLLLFEQILDYLQLYEITTFVKYLEKMVNRSEDVNRNSKEQAALNCRVLARIQKLIATRKKEEMECTAIFLEGFSKWRECKHKTTAIFYVFYYFIRKQLVLENSHVNIRSYIETLAQYLDRHSNIAQILSYYDFEENTFVSRLQNHLNALPLELKEQTNDVFRLSLPQYFSKWTAKKSFVGYFERSQLQMLNKNAGTGGQADVLLCKTNKFFCPVVFKSFTNKSAHREIFAELGSLILLQAHPHIVRLFGFVVEKGIRIGILMEYCTGGSLDKLIKQEDYCFEEDKTVHWMGQAASGLSFLHSNNIIHTDLKSHNMLLSADHRLLKLADMGCCKDISFSTDGKAQYTNLRGTAGYMAPELEQAETFSPAADIFSLGRTLWSLIFKELTPDGLKFAITVYFPLKENNSPLFDQEQFEKITYYINDKDTIVEGYNKIKKSLPQLPEKMLLLLLRLTAIDPDQRPKSEQIYQEFTDYYDELLKTMNPERKAQLEFYPEIIK